MYNTHTSFLYMPRAKYIHHKLQTLMLDIQGLQFKNLQVLNELQIQLTLHIRAMQIKPCHTIITNTKFSFIFFNIITITLRLHVRLNLITNYYGHDMRLQKGKPRLYSVKQPTHTKSKPLNVNQLILQLVTLNIH